MRFLVFMTCIDKSDDTVPNHYFTVEARSWRAAYRLVARLLDDRTWLEQHFGDTCFLEAMDDGPGIDVDNLRILNLDDIFSAPPLARDRPAHRRVE